MQQHELTLYEVSKAVTFIESENGTVVTRAWGRGKWGVILISGQKVSGHQHERVLELCCTTLSNNMLST